MRIRKMTAHFGVLDGASLTLSDGLNILYAPNESGKSTWCAFLRAMLFGVSTSQRARTGQQPDKLKYRPWSGAPMSGSMDLDSRMGAVTVRRWTERDTQPMQAFSATVTGTDLPVQGLSGDNAGEMLAGMPAEVFERTVFIRQSGLEVSNDPELERRISAIVSSGDEEVSFTEAEKRLKSWQRHRRSGNRGAVPELQAEMDETRRSLEAIREHSRTAAEADEEIAVLEQRYKQMETGMHRARAEQRRRSLTSMAEAHAAVREAEKACAAAEEKLGQIEEALRGTPYALEGPEEAARQSEIDRNTLIELRSSADRKASGKLVFIPLALAAAAFVLALFLPWKAECAGVGCVLVLLFAALFARSQAARRKRAELLAERGRVLESYGVREPEDIRRLTERYGALWKQRQRASLRLATAQAMLEEKRADQKAEEERTLAALDFADGDNEAARASREMERIRSRIVELRERRAMAEGQARALGDPLILESELAEAERRHTELLRQEEALALALETLNAADDELQRRISPVLARKAAEYFSELTEGRYDEVTLARDLTAQARLSGDDVGRELDYLSAGAKDQLYLALRLAVCELALSEDDPCPIILDDALVTFDRERMALALRLMKRIAQRRQVLVFSCHERESAFFADDGDVMKITLK